LEEVESKKSAALANKTDNWYANATLEVTYNAGLTNKTPHGS